MHSVQKGSFKKDGYMRKRGSPSMLLMRCAHCHEYVMSYQKDGPGPLLRCYLDRIHHPEQLERRQREVFDKKTSPKLECPACRVVIGFPVIYEKENRPAYQLRPGCFSLKKIF